MRILICFEYRDNSTIHSANGIVNGFKSLNYNVRTCGPKIGNYDGELLSKHDIPVYDRHLHPEKYDYEEIINLYRKKYGFKPDLIIQTDPHFYLTGKKPKDIACVYWVLDPHRGPTVFRQMAIEGQFDKIFITQKYYMPVFERAGLNCNYLPFGYDDTVIYEHPEVKEECDISFIGTTGLPNQDREFNEKTQISQHRIYFDEELGLKYIKFDFLIGRSPEYKYAGWNNRSMEYAERLEHLIRLSKDFDVRIYEKCYDETYARALSRGKIGFHFSLRRDITLRVFEIPAVNRLLLTDEVPYLDKLMFDNQHLRTFRPYYQPQFAGFDFDYEEVKELVVHYLKDGSERKDIAYNGRDWVMTKHSFKNRAEEMLEVLSE